MITPEEQKLGDLEYVKRCTIPYVLLKTKTSFPIKKRGPRPGFFLF